MEWIFVKCCVGIAITRNLKGVGIIFSKKYLFKNYSLRRSQDYTHAIQKWSGNCFQRIQKHKALGQDKISVEVWKITEDMGLNLLINYLTNYKN